jgi:hypothetical protein
MGPDSKHSTSNQRQDGNAKNVAIPSGVGFGYRMPVTMSVV